MTSDDNTGWKRLTTKQAFVEAFADKILVGEGMHFILHFDGRISGRIGENVLSGNWYWSEGYFCRTASLNDEDLGLDCEIIERRGQQMRYTRDKGRGDASIVDVELP